MRTARSVEVSSVGVRLSSVLKPHSSLLTHQFSILNFSILTPQSSVLGPQFSVWKPCIFVAGRLNTFFLLHKHWVTAFLLQLSRKTQHTRFEEIWMRTSHKLCSPGSVELFCETPVPDSLSHPILSFFQISGNQLYWKDEWKWWQPW